MSQETKSARRSILLVHGRDFKPDADTLLELSSAGIRHGISRDFPSSMVKLENVEMDLAYYGDLSNQLLESFGRRIDERLDIGDREAALTRLREIPARKRFGIRQYDRLPGKSAVPEAIADSIYPLLGMIGLSLPIISRMSRDFGVYLKGDGDYANNVRARVRDKLCEMLDRGDDILLMSHGTGSAVCWDVLWQLSHDPGYSDHYGERKISLWLTLGAPLGDRRIRKRLLGADSKAPAAFPTNVISWYNVSAEDDYTCHDKTLADDFKKMMKERVVSCVTDYRICNHAVRYGRSNPHSSIGYYVHPRVSKIVIDWLGGPLPEPEPVVDD